MGAGNTSSLQWGCPGGGGKARKERQNFQNDFNRAKKI
jgi:hypothetical protein